MSWGHGPSIVGVVADPPEWRARAKYSKYIICIETGARSNRNATNNAANIYKNRSVQTLPKSNTDSQDKKMMKGIELTEKTTVKFTLNKTYGNYKITNIQVA